MSDRYDVIIIGSGAGGGTLAHRLAPSGKRILLLERGDWLPREPQNWRAEDVFVDDRYISPDTWYDADGKPFQPQVHYFVGGATKLYGAALYRLREQDFGELRHHDGISPAWPISYEEMEPYYTQAEQLYRVHGARGEDPTEPSASAPYPYPAVSHEPRIQQLADDLAAAGLHPFHAPCGVLLDEAQHAVQPLRPLSTTATASPAWSTPSPTPRCIAVRPALEHPNVTLLTNAQAVRLETNPAGTAVTEVVVDHGGGAETFHGRPRGRLLRRRQQRQAAAGIRVATRTRTASPTAPTSSGATTCSTTARPCSRSPRSRTRRSSRRRSGSTTSTSRAATPASSRWATSRWSASRRPPMFRGEKPGDTKLAPDLVAQGGRRARDRLLALDRGPARAREPRDARRATATSSIDYRSCNDTAASSGSSTSSARCSGDLGMHEHHLIPRRAYLKNKIPVAGVRAPGGYRRFGTDPATSVLDTDCRAHEVDNLYVVDTSFFPSIAAVNPALTAMANAIRVGDHLLERMSAREPQPEPVEVA